MEIAKRDFYYVDYNYDLPNVNIDTNTNTNTNTKTDIIVNILKVCTIFAFGYLTRKYIYEKSKERSEEM